MIVSFVIMILLLLLFTTIEGPAETLVTVAFLTFFFVYLLRLLNVINKPFNVGSERNDDDVSLFLLYEFVVHARLADADPTGEQIVEIAEHLRNTRKWQRRLEQPLSRGETRQRLPILTRSWTPPWRRFRASRSRTPTASDDLVTRL
jgi:hypothetical protein